MSKVIKPNEILSDLRLAKHDKINQIDWRDIINGNPIPTEYYSDQPYIVKADDGAWLCVHTTGSKEEGSDGQHVVSSRSCDYGKTWSKLVDVESPDGPEASYAVLLKTNFGRIYCMYNYNADNVRRVKANNPPYADGYCYRVDSLGHFVFKYTDDNGLSWSQQRYDIPSREFEIDRNNADKGKLRYFWNVGKPLVYEDNAYCSLHKVGGFGDGFFTSSEGVLLKSINIMNEKDPNKIMWETLPDGDIGLRTPEGGGPIAEEQSYCLLSDGSFYCVYRSGDGYSVFTYSRDKGKTWDKPKYKAYQDGRLMKHPRAANFAWKCNNGKYLYWFHNHGGCSYDDRNPVWVCGGVEVDSPKGKVINWTQPEVLLYYHDSYVRMSYPDLLEDDGRVFISETQKDIPRVHEIDNKFLEKLWNQFEACEIVDDGLVRTITKCEIDSGCVDYLFECNFNERDVSRPDYGARKLQNSFSVDAWVKMDNMNHEYDIVNNLTDNGTGLRIFINNSNAVEILINDGRGESRWSSDPVITVGKYHHVGIVVDSGPNIISFIIDGKFCDGSNYRQFGFGRFSKDLRNINGKNKIKIGDIGIDIMELRLYKKALMNSELVSNYNFSKLKY